MGQFRFAEPSSWVLVDSQPRAGRSLRHKLEGIDLCATSGRSWEAGIPGCIKVNSIASYKGLKSWQ